MAVVHEVGDGGARAEAELTGRASWDHRRSAGAELGALWWQTSGMDRSGVVVCAVVAGVEMSSRW